MLKNVKSCRQSDQLVNTRALNQSFRDFHFKRTQTHTQKLSTVSTHAASFTQLVLTLIYSFMYYLLT